MTGLTVFAVIFSSFFLRQVKKLQSILKPMMLRRLKDDVEKNLAPKEETIIEVGLNQRFRLISYAGVYSSLCFCLFRWS